MLITNNTIEYVYPTEQTEICEITNFLNKNNIQIDKNIEIFITIRSETQEIIACGGLAQNIIKCVAIDQNARNQGLTLSLISALISFAASRGQHQLFIYTKPENERLFIGSGFYPLTRTKDVVLLENSAHRLEKYRQYLNSQRQAGTRIGAIVMNANPFTLGHRYLIEKAQENCDWLHIFVVGEDKSQFSYSDRLHMVKAGTADLDRITIHEGTPYIISRATFPSYFLKSEQMADKCHLELDATLFRRQIAPALGINMRFVGSEPFCPTTGAYNQMLREVFSNPHLPEPAIQYIELERKSFNGKAISASKVRDLLQKGDWAAIAQLVPETTYSFLNKN